jgi:flagellar biosynthesis protein FlhA
MSQIPALLISVATGMMVTRSASEADFNTDFLNQFKSQPLVLIIAGIALVFLTLIGFPPLQTCILAGILIALGILLLRTSNKQLEAIQEILRQR